jgi:GTP-binding protein
MKAARSAGARRPARAGERDTPLPRAEEMEQLPVVALVGRPNTGKSTLFNRLTRSRRALVAPTPGVTRDRNIAVAEHGGRRFLLFDTGGFEADEQEELGKAVRIQALVAAQEADVVVLIVDGRAGLNPLDAALARELRPLPKPLFVAVNKMDTPKQTHEASEFYALGIDALHRISAEHGVDVDTLMDAVVQRLPEPAAEAQSVRGEAPTAVAIIGRPNVGKSSLLNRLVGYERSIVTAVPGTTRDAIDTPLARDGRAYLLVDTAGVRRRPKVQAHLERASVVRALRALERAEVGLLVIDAVEGMTEQDARIAGYAWERGRALLLAVNKWDAVPPERRDRRARAREIDRRYPSLSVVPKLFLSALTGRGVQSVWEAIDAVVSRHRAHLPTAQLNQVVGRAVEQHAPPIVKGKRARFFYATQTAKAPVTVTIFAGAPDRVPAAYERYLANKIRSAFDLQGAPLRLRFRARERRSRQRRARR